MAGNTEAPIQKIIKDPDPTPGKKPKSQNYSNNKFVFPALIIALGALGIAAYTLFLNGELQNQITHTNTTFPAQVKQLEQNQSQTQKELKAKINGTEKMHAELQTQFNEFSTQVQNTLKQKFYQNQNWILLKARYYLELAQINAHWSNNQDSTITLLNQADLVLKQVNFPKIFDIRQTIAKDIAQIQALPHIDSVGILSQLDALRNRINDLSIPLPASNLHENITKPTNKHSTWHSHLEDSMDLLGKLVVIRRHDQNIKPLISPLLESLYKERIQLYLQEAQWAVLNNNPSVYQLMLKQAIDILKANFNENLQNTSVLIKKLIELQKITLTQEKPTVDSALSMLNELIDDTKNPADKPRKSEQGGDQ